MFLKTIEIYDFELFIRKVKVGGDKTAAVLVDFLYVFRNEFGKHKANTSCSIGMVETPICAIQKGILQRSIIVFEESLGIAIREFSFLKADNGKGFFKTILHDSIEFRRIIDTSNINGSKGNSM